MSRHPAATTGTRQRGVALLTAMLTVTLVATFAAAALWQQWRAAELEAAERTRMQSAWVLVSALDWSRLILREDARPTAGVVGVDSFQDIWSQELKEARLSSFLAADKNIASDALEGLPDAFLSGQIVDAQSKLNVMNLVSGNKPVPSAVAAFTRLFATLGLPVQEVQVLTANLQRAVAGTVASASAPGDIAGAALVSAATGGASPQGAASPSASDSSSTSGEDGNAPLLPQQVDQLVWLGLSPATVTAIQPYVTILPINTPVNINTASAVVLAASVASLDVAGAQRLVAQRQQRPFIKLSDARALLPGVDVQFADDQQSVGTSYFEVYGRMRLDKSWVEENSLVRRTGATTTVVWRERRAGALAAAQIAVQSAGQPARR